MSTSLASVLRCERKFELAGVSRAQIESWVYGHPALFRRTYPPRHINNLYLDTLVLSAYAAAADGEGERAKTRVRWYHDVYGAIPRPQLEFKRKAGAVSRKSVYALAPFTLHPGFGVREVRALLERSALPDEVRARLAGLDAVLFNRYLRSYWETPDGCFRLTIDTELVGCPLRRLHNRQRAGYEEAGVAVVELKYDTRYDDRAAAISSALPLRLTRHSKYVEGIERGHGRYGGGLAL